MTVLSFHTIPQQPASEWHSTTNCCWQRSGRHTAVFCAHAPLMDPRLCLCAMPRRPALTWLFSTRLWSVRPTLLLSPSCFFANVCQLTPSCWSIFHLSPQNLPTWDRDTKVCRFTHDCCWSSDCRPRSCFPHLSFPCFPHVGLQLPRPQCLRWGTRQFLLDLQIVVDL